MRSFVVVVSISLAGLFSVVSCGSDERNDSGGSGADSGSGGHGGGGHSGGGQGGGGHSHGGQGHGGQGGAGEILDPCCELGAICHVIGDDIDPEIVACHNLGHRNDQDACLEEYDHCQEICAGLNDDPMPHSCR